MIRVLVEERPLPDVTLSSWHLFRYGITSDDGTCLFCVDEHDFTVIHCIKSSVSNSGSNKLNLIYNQFKHCQTQNEKLRLQPREKYGSIIHHNDNIFLFGGKEITNDVYCNDLWCFNLSNYNWRQVKISGEIPAARKSHAFVKYKQYGVIFGGKSQSRVDLRDIFLLDLNSFVCKGLGLSKKVIGDIYGIPQIINDKILIVHNEFRGYYWIDLEKLTNHTKLINVDFGKWSDGSGKTEILGGKCVCSKNSNRFITYESVQMLTADCRVFIIDKNRATVTKMGKKNGSRFVRTSKDGTNSTVNIKQNHLCYGYYLRDTIVWICNFKEKHLMKTNVIILEDIEQIDDFDDDTDFVGWKFDKKYKCMRKIGCGATSIVYDAMINPNGHFTEHRQFVIGNKIGYKQLIAIKQQTDFIVNSNNDIDNSNSNNQNSNIYPLINEYTILQKISSSFHCSDISCRLIDFFVESKMNHLVVSKLGVSMQHLLIENQNKMTVIQVSFLVTQMISILYKLHCLGYVHNDIKPQNILIGNDSEHLNKVYLIDFGIAKCYWDYGSQKHIKQKLNVQFEGTFRFSSINHHCNQMSNQSRRDDLESMLLVAIYLHTNYLPWIINDRFIKQYQLNTREKIYTKTKELKEKSTVSTICKNVSKQFEIALNYVRNLKFDETPDYVYLQSLFTTLADEKNTNGLNVSFYPSKLHIAANSNSIDFIGARIIKNVKNTAKHNGVTNINHLLDYNRIQKLNESMINDYNKNSGLGSNGTKQNYQTLMSIHGLKNRMGYLINSLSMSTSVPLKQPKIGNARNDNYGGIIVYKKSSHDINNNKINGTIYMLPIKQCNEINEKYFQKNGTYLNGQIHGAIYYHFFEENIHLETKYDVKKQEILSFVRGFSFYTNTNKFSFNSGAFNMFNFQLKDYKYKQLSQSEATFVEYSIRKFWLRNQSTKRFGGRQQASICYFDEFIKSKAMTTNDTLNDNNKLKDIEEEKFHVDVDEFDEVITASGIAVASGKKFNSLKLHQDDSVTQTKISQKVHIGEIKEYSLGILKQLTEKPKPRKNILDIKKIKLSIDLIELIFVFLNDKEQSCIRLVGRRCNQLMKYYCFTKSQRMFIAFVSELKISDSESINQAEIGIDIRIKECKKKNLKVSQINFDDLSINHNEYNSNNDKYYLMIDHYCGLNDSYNNGNNVMLVNNAGLCSNINKDLCRIIITSLNHFNLFLPRLEKNINGCNCDIINYSYPLKSNICLRWLWGDEFAPDGDHDDANEPTIVWYWKKTGADDEWQRYDKDLQTIIENAFSVDLKSQVVFDVKGGDQSQTNKYCVLFSHQTRESNLTKLEREYHSIANYRWRDGFTDYFYQKNVLSSKCRIVRRVNWSMVSSFILDIQQMVENYFI